MPRRSSKLPSATATGLWSIDMDPEFQRKLKRVARPHAGLRKILSDYVFAAQAEKSAAKVADAKKVADALKKRFEAFAAALNAGPLPVRNEIDAHIEDCLAQRNRFELRRVGDPRDPSEITSGLRLSVIADLAGELVVACEYARQRLTEHEGQDYYRPGQAWDDFIRALAGWWKTKKGKRATASKGHSKQSPFVVFAFSVQCLLPPMYHQHMGGSTSVDYPPNSFGEAVANVLQGG